MKIKFEYFSDVPEEHSWLASIESNEYKGMCETGANKNQAFQELMASLIVKIAHDNNIEL